MKIKTSDLEGAALDWAVALANKNSRVFICEGEPCTKEFSEEHGDFFAEPYSPSTEWCHGGPLIDKYEISFATIGTGPRDKNGKEPVVSTISGVDGGIGEGRSHLTAACRAIVAAKIGDEVDIPEELA